MEMDDNRLQTSGCDTRWSQQLSGLPHKLLQRLMPFQREGVEFALSKNGRCMIADEMGLGKTVQAIAVAYAFRQEWPLLVVVPSSLKYPWIEELERWIPELQPGDINLVENKSHTMGISSSKVTVLGYGLLTTDARPLVEALSRQRFAVVVVDESHYLKSRNTARTKILAPLIQSAKRAILLTGTPALGRPEELFMQIDALYPKMCGTWTDYAKKYCNAHYRYFGPRRQWDCRGASNLEELHKRLSQIMIRRLKAEVLTQLPPKIRQRIPFDLPKEAAKEASASFAEWERLMKGLGSSGVVTTDNPFTQVMGLVTQMYKQTAIAKAGAVKDYIKMMLEAEQLKFLVFAHHLTMLQACTEAVIEAKAGYIRIDGSVPSSERIQLVHKFQSDPETRVAVLSIQAAGQGLTFTAASHVVFAELYWNPGHIKQAEDRAHRIGQTSSVNVHYLIAKGTFDTVMWSMLNRKETVTGSTLNGRKEYLKADEGDKDKWEFLSFADAWEPSEMVLPLQGNAGNVKDDVFFTHFEKEKQHDIRAFFSPSASKEKKRKRLEGEETSPSISSETSASPTGAGTDSEKSEEKKSCPQTSAPPDQDFSPQLKRLRTPQPSPSTRSQFGGKRRSTAGKAGSGSPSAQAFFMAPRKLSEPDPPTETWSCGACTYSNSSLLPYCEMCEFPRSSSGNSSVLYLSKDEVAQASLSRAQQDGGSVRLVATEKLFTKRRSAASLTPPASERQDKESCKTVEDQPSSESGYLQAVDSEGVPLCLSCQKACSTTGGAWDTRFCSHRKCFNLNCNSRITSLMQTDLVLYDITDPGDLILGNVTSILYLCLCRQDKESCKTVEDQPSSESGYLQAVDSEGVPLCLSCQKACSTTGGAWDTRFCSHRCQDEFQLRSSQTYMRSRVLEAEQGICQHCGLHAHDLFLKVRDAPPSQRKDMLENTWLTQLSLKQLNEMIRAPVEGDFWQVDHIRPVYSGGGQCSLDNLQTLCTVCHKARTAQQAKQRSQMRKSAAASKVASDISRFFFRK
ncbi:DNA annealing helicase and endonuclease ZRANB3 [Micropterus dolomieu]|uniref:DNA annealing helicase and endonuclease ZRANB3 n=1 Tax=Micropterus dolomieu TaxID=147949 RepID=UPI001E8D2DAE|nr:DNA annealing helicase and endonuclease ZRANB3 [Micropterus dolomieu]